MLCNQLQQVQPATYSQSSICLQSSVQLMCLLTCIYMPACVCTGLISIFNTLEVLDMFHQIQSTSNQGKNYFSHILDAAGKITFLLTILY